MCFRGAAAAVAPLAWQRSPRGAFSGAFSGPLRTQRAQAPGLAFLSDYSAACRAAPCLGPPPPPNTEITCRDFWRAEEEAQARPRHGIRAGKVDTALPLLSSSSSPLNSKVRAELASPFPPSLLGRLASTPSPPRRSWFSCRAARPPLRPPSSLGCCHGARPAGRLPPLKQCTMAAMRGPGTCCHGDRLLPSSSPDAPRASHGTFCSSAWYKEWPRSPARSCACVLMTMQRPHQRADKNTLTHAHTLATREPCLPS